VKIVGVFPDIQTEDRSAQITIGNDPLHLRVVLVGRADDLEFAILDDQPSPARAEALGPSFREHFLKSSIEPKVVCKALPSSEEGAPELAAGVMIFQKKSWFQWPPPLFRIVVRKA